jgi:F-type H+-transporting ATPase subunit beta
MDASTATESTGAALRANGARSRNVGRIEEIQGVVIEATFSERLPEINHAITVARPAAAADEEAPGVSASAGGGVPTGVGLEGGAAVRVVKAGWRIRMQMPM